MNEHFFEIVLQSCDSTFESRDEVEDPLAEALAEAGVGEVTGGGSGMGMANIDIDATDFDKALAIIRQVLQELGVAPSTEINYLCESQNSRKTHPVYK